MNRIGVGIIGDGVSCYRHCHAINSDSRFVLSSIAPKDMAKGLELKRMHNIPRLEADPEFMLERDDIDAVVLSVPTEDHASFIRYAQKYDKIVVIESPVTLSPEDGEKIYSEVKDEGAFFFNANPYLYSPSLKSINPSPHSFLLSFSSVYLKKEEMLHIALEVLISAFGDVRDIIRDRDGSYRVAAGRGKGRINLLSRSDRYGLSLTVDGNAVLSNAVYYSLLPSFYSYLYDRMSDGRTTEDTFRYTIMALEAERKLSSSCM